MKNILIISHQEMWVQSFLSYMNVVNCNFNFYRKISKNQEIDSVLIHTEFMESSEVLAYVLEWKKLPVFAVHDGIDLPSNVSGVFPSSMSLRDIVRSLSIFFVEGENYIYDSEQTGRPNFTDKEALVLSHLSLGDSDKLIASQTGMPLSSVKYYIRSLYKKLKVNNRHQAISKVRDIPL